jgi:hypothetical protein
LPLVDNPGGMPYPTTNEVMNVARARVNDMMNGVEGDLLANDVPASQTYLTAAWKWYQARCDTAGVQTFIRSVLIYGIPKRASNDVGNESCMSWSGCTDGVNQFETPALPQDMISPKSIWRRRFVTPNAEGAQVLNTDAFQLMEQAVDGLPVIFDCNVYDWREDGIYFYGTNYAQDWKFRYSAYRASLDISKPDSIVPMMMCEDCLGSRVAFEYANARGAAQASTMEAWAETAFNTTSQRATRIKQRQSIRRQPYSRGAGGGNRWPVNFTGTN